MRSFLHRALTLLMILCLLLPSAACAELSKGDSGEAVIELQTMLFEMGYLFYTPDGQYGSRTENAIRDYQAAKGLEETGIASAELIKMIEHEWNIYTYGEDPNYAARPDADMGYKDGMPICCTQQDMTDGNSATDYCEAHMSIRAETKKLMATGALDDAKAVYMIWRSEIVRLYNTLLSRAASGKSPPLPPHIRSISQLLKRSVRRLLRFPAILTTRQCTMPWNPPCANMPRGCAR